MLQSQFSCCQIDDICFEYYTTFSDKTSGLMADAIGGYKAEHIEFVCGFDVDERKMDLLLSGLFLPDQIVSSFCNKDERKTTDILIDPARYDPDLVSTIRKEIIQYLKLGTVRSNVNRVRHYIDFSSF